MFASINLPSCPTHTGETGQKAEHSELLSRIGIDRLYPGPAELLGQESIRDVILFPQLKPKRTSRTIAGMIRAVGFDLGDTLLFYRDTPMSWVALYPDALAAVATSCKAQPTAEQFERAKEILTQHNTRVVPRTREIPAEMILGSILEAWGLDPVKHSNAAIEAFFSFFQQRLNAYPETVSVLQTLRAHRIPTGILTDVAYGMPHTFVQRDISGADITNLLDVLLTSVEVGVRKPDPTGYRELAKRLKVEPNQMLYIGNEAKDVIGAKHAGAFSVFLDRNNSGANHGQDFTVSTLTGLYEILGLNLKPHSSTPAS